MEHIDVRDLPEPIAQAIQAMVKILRQQLVQSAPRGKVRDLPRWEGEVLGTLTRDEIYDDTL